MRRDCYALILESVIRIAHWLIRKLMKTRILLMVLCAALASTNIHAADLTGEYVTKPVRIGAGGWLRGLIVDPSDPRRRYARSDVHGAFRWDVSSDQWQQMARVSVMPESFGRYPTVAPSVGLAFDPRNSNTVLMALAVKRTDDIPQADQINRIRVYRSMDGGRSFPQEGDLNLSIGGEILEERGERLVIDPNNSNIAYYTSDQQGLWRSQNGGLNWTNVVRAPQLTGNTATRFLRFDAGGGTTLVNGQTVSARQYLIHAGGAFFESRDGGQNYSAVAGGPSNSAGSVTVNRNGDLYVGELNGPFLWRKPRDGSWSRTQLANGNIRGIAPDPRSTDRLFVSHQGGGLSRINAQGAGLSPTYLGDATLITQSPIAWLRPDPTRRPLGRYRSLGGLAMDNTGKLWQSLGNDGIITTIPNDASNGAANPPTWQVDAVGIEQMVGTHALIPPGQKPLLSFLDETSFLIDDPDQFNAVPYNINTWAPSVPNAGGDNNGLSSSGTTAFCPNDSSYIVNTTADMLVGNAELNGEKYAGYSTNGGRSFTLFGSIANNTHPALLANGNIAVSARAPGDSAANSNLVWLPAPEPDSSSAGGGIAPYYSTDGGQSWRQTTSFNGLSGVIQERGVARFPEQWGNWDVSLLQQMLIADPQVKGTFYLYLVSKNAEGSSGAVGRFYKSTDGGASWQLQSGGAQLPLSTHSGQMVANPNASGDLWIVDGLSGYKTVNGQVTKGLWRTTDGGQIFQYFAGFEYTISVSLGKAVTPGAYPTIYVAGRRAEGWGIYRSINQGASWDKISKEAFDYNDRIAGIAASPDEFGLVYVVNRGTSAVYMRPIASAVNSAGARPAQNSIIAIKAQALGRVISAENAGNAPLVANRSIASVWEQFTVDINASGEVSFKSSANGLFVCADSFGNSPLIANRSAALGSWERFDWLDQGDGSFVLRAKANNQFVQIKADGTLLASTNTLASAARFVRVQL
jgi:hypothetical protein